MRALKTLSISFLLSSTFLLNILFCSSGNTNNIVLEEPIFKEETPQREITHYKDRSKHLVLIYDGGVHRSIRWTQEHFSPYINYFAEGNALHALNAQIDAVLKSEQIKEKFEKRKIVLSLPEPIPSQTDWGVLNGRPLRFSNKRDRLDACIWYVDYAEEMFRKEKLDHLELVGFYWLAEEATNSRDLAGDVADYVYRKKYDFYWIPYFNSDGYSEWEKLGFNSVYYQPNYFFNDNIPYSRLQEACDRAKKLQMNMEVEFDDRVLKNNNDWGYRLNDYLDVYEKNGIFDSLRVAYYQGGDTFYKLSKSDKEGDKLLYRRLVNLITKER